MIIRNELHFGHGSIAVTVKSGSYTIELEEIDPPSEIPVSRNQLSSCVHNAIISNSKPYGYGVICIYKHFRYHPHATAILSPEFKNIGT